MSGAVKYPLYRCKMEDGEEPRSFRIITPTRHVYLQCSTDDDMVSWLNSLLKQKIVVEDRIDSIMIESMRTRREEEEKKG